MRSTFAALLLFACFIQCPEICLALFSKETRTEQTNRADTCLPPTAGLVTPPLRLRRLGRRSLVPPFANLKLDCNVECSHCCGNDCLSTLRGGFLGSNTAPTEAQGLVLEKSFVQWMPLNAWKALMQVRSTFAPYRHACRIRRQALRPARVWINSTREGVCRDKEGNRKASHPLGVFVRSVCVVFLLSTNSRLPCVGSECYLPRCALSLYASRLPHALRLSTITKSSHTHTGRPHQHQRRLLARPTPLQEFRGEQTYAVPGQRVLRWSVP